jgi:protein O-GlcNAc transferase
MRLRRTRVSIAFVCSILFTAPVDPTRLRAEPQASPASATAAPTSNAALDARLTKIRNDLFTKPDGARTAVRELLAILAEDPGSSQAHTLLGLAYSGLGSQDMLAEAVAELRQALALDPRLVVARFYLARVYLDLSQHERAREEMETALAVVPGRPELLATLAEAERRLGHGDKAVAAASKALETDPRFDQARYTLALSLIDLKRRPEALQQLEQLAQAATPMPAALFSLASLYLDLERLDPALGMFARAMQMTEPTPQVRLQLARALRLKGLLPDADEQLNRVFPPNVSVQASAAYQQLETDLSVERGLIRLQLGRLDEAAGLFRAAIDMDPSSGIAHRSLAEVYLKQKRFSDAAGEAARARALGNPLSAVLQRTLDAAVSPPRPGARPQ